MKILEALTRDSRYARGALLRAPAFSTGVIATLALGIATATAALSVAHRVLLEPLPVRDERDVLVMWTNHRETGQHYPLWGTDYRAFARSTRMFTSAAGVDYNGAWPRAIWANDSAGTAVGTMVTGNFFDVLGVRPVIGRLLRTDDDQSGSAGAVVISEGYWRRAFGGDSAVVGKRIRVSGDEATIVGVIPSAFRFPNNTELWLPIGRYSRAYGTPDADSLRAYVDVVGRLRPGRSITDGRAELGAYIHGSDPSLSPAMKRLATKLSSVATPLRQSIVGEVEGPITVVAAAAALLLAVTLVSTAGLMLVRALGRERELAIRAALGAARSRLAMQVLTEAMLLGVFVATLGIALANAAVRVFVAFAPIDLPLIGDVSVNGSIAAVVTGVSLLALASFALVPVLMSGRGDGEVLRERVVTGARRTTLLREWLVAVQVAIAVCALMTAGVALRSVRNLMHIDLGFDAGNVAMLQLVPRPGAPARSFDDELRAVERIADAMRATPGVTNATPLLIKPLAGAGGWDFPYRMPGDGPGGVPGRPRLNVVPSGPHYLETLGTRLVAGRAFNDDDRAGSTPVAIVDVALAKQLWPGKDPIGQSIAVTTEGGAMQRVVGVVEDTRYRELLTPRPTIYVPFRQLTRFTPTYVAARTSSDAAAMLPTLRSIVGTTDPTFSVMTATTLRREVAAPLATPRLSSFLLATFAVSIVVLATVGVYGLVAAYTRTRRLDIAIRLALGADAPSVRRLVLRRATILTGVGGVAGGIVVLFASGLLRRVVFGVSPTDPATLLAAVTLPLIVALVACSIPARRAAATNPADALKEFSSAG